MEHNRDDQQARVDEMLRDLAATALGRPRSEEGEEDIDENMRPEQHLNPVFEDILSLDDDWFLNERLPNNVANDAVWTETVPA